MLSFFHCSMKLLELQYKTSLTFLLFFTFTIQFHKEKNYQCVDGFVECFASSSSFSVSVSSKDVLTEVLVSFKNSTNSSCKYSQVSMLFHRTVGHHCNQPWKPLLNSVHSNWFCAKLIFFLSVCFFSANLPEKQLQFWYPLIFSIFISSLLHSYLVWKTK